MTPAVSSNLQGACGRPATSVREASASDVGAGGRRSSNLRERTATVMHDAHAGMPVASVREASVTAMHE
jgi:hypothetical protein